MQVKEMKIDDSHVILGIIVPAKQVAEQIHRICINRVRQNRVMPLMLLLQIR